MDMNTIRQMVAQDSIIDDTELDTESLKIPQLHSKYLNIYSDEKLELLRMETELRVLKRKKWEYYTGKMSKEDLDDNGWEPFQLKVLKQDLDLYLESDKDLIRMSALIAYQKEKVDYIESFLKALNKRNWIIRNAIDFLKFKNGIV